MDPRSARLALLFMSFLAPALAFAAVPASAPAGLPKNLPPAVKDFRLPHPIPWMKATEFLPARDAGKDAVEAYVKAAADIRRMPGYPRVPNKAEAYRAEGPLRDSLQAAFDAASCANADFLKRFSYRPWEEDSMPDLPAMLIAGRAMARSARFFLESGDLTTARKVAQAAIGMGEHFRSSAPILPQAYVGEQIIEEALIVFRLCARRAGDEAMAEKAAAVLSSNHSAIEDAEIKSAAARVLLWKDPLRALDSLKEPDAVVRADALLFLEGCFDPAGTKRLRKDESMAPIVDSLRSKAADIRPAVKALRADPDAMVRKLAERVDRVIASP